jgi:hypothetical protein
MTEKTAPSLLITTRKSADIAYPSVVNNTAGPSKAGDATTKRIKVIPPKPPKTPKVRKNNKSNPPKGKKSVEKSAEVTGE